MLLPYFCLIGQSRRRALSRLTLSGQLFSGHQVGQVLLQRGEVELLERLGIVEVRREGIGPGRMLVEQVDPQALRPPVAIGRAAAGGVIERTFRFARHQEVSSGLPGRRTERRRLVVYLVPGSWPDCEHCRN
jgi:hypothetical protein